MKNFFLYLFFISFFNLIFLDNALAKISEFDFLDQLQNNKCSFEFFEEKKIPENLNSDFIFKNINYNSCSKILSSYISSGSHETHQHLWVF